MQPAGGIASPGQDGWALKTLKINENPLKLETLNKT